jgi:hypothetical protein
MSNKASALQRLWLAILAALWLLPASTDASEAASVPTFSAAYTVRYGVLRGAMTLELRQEGSGYLYETSLRPGAIVSLLRRGAIREVSTLAITDAGVRPVDYANTDTLARPNRYAAYVFDETSGMVTGEYKSRVVEVPMRPRGHNRISAHVAIMHKLQTGAEISAFPVFDKGRWRDFEFETILDQSVETPSGRYETVEIRYSSSDKEKSWSLHCASALHYLPVMIEFREGGKIKSSAQLTSYRLEDDRSE